MLFWRLLRHRRQHHPRFMTKSPLLASDTPGHELPVEALTRMELPLDPVILDPGRRAAAPVGWAGWCGDEASGVVRVNWVSGSALLEVEGPRQPGCPDPGSRRTSLVLV